MNLRNLLLAACVSLSAASVPTPATAFIDVTVQAPPGVNWETISGVLGDGSVDGSDLAGLAFQSFWSAVSQVMSRAEICQEANGSLGTTAHGRFSVTTTVVNADGDKQITYSQVMAVRAFGDDLGVAPIIGYSPDGYPIYGPMIRCPASWRNRGHRWAAEAPDPTERGGADRWDFLTEAGLISVHLPSDMAAGDTISGTVTAEPAGSTPGERQANSDRLQGMVVEFNGARTAVRDRVIRTALGSGITILAVAEGDRVVASSIMELITSPDPMVLDLPEVGQAGRPVEIPGPFDGDASNTNVEVNGQPCPVVAESPRQVSFVPPADTVGPMTLRVSEGNATAEGRYNNVGVRLTAGATTLQRGQQTNLSVRLFGLQGLAQPLSLALQASESVQLQGGNSQTIGLASDAGDANGEWEQRFNLRARQAGPFDVTATVGPR